MKYYYLFKYYLFIFLLLIIFKSNSYNKNIKINDKNIIEIIHPTYKDYLYWKEGTKIKKINVPLSINILYNKYSFINNTNKLISFNNKNYNISLIPNLNLPYKNYLSKKDISYFNVKTPTTQLIYENNMNGILFQTIFTQNPKKNMNYSIHYKSLYPKKDYFSNKSLYSKIKYKNQLSSINYFLTTFNYNDIENKYYKIWIHFINYYINNQESNSIKLRKKIPILFNNPNNILNIKRWYIGQCINLNNNIYLINRLEYENKLSTYIEKKYKNIFGNVFINLPRKNEIYYHKISNEFTIRYFFKKNIFLNYGIGYYKLLYYPIFKNHKLSIKNNIFSFFSNIESNLFNKININFFGKYLLLNNNYKYNIYYIFFKTKYNISFSSKIEGRLIFSNINTDFNIILNKSFYKQNNYFNKFKNILTKQIYFNFINKYVNIYFNIYHINNYIYIASNNPPKEYKERLEIFNFYFYKIFSFKKIKYNFFLKFQKNNYKNYIFKIPNLIIRNCLFYENVIFKKKILFKTGIILKYFTKYLNSYKEPFISYLSTNMVNLSFIDYFINIEFFRIKAYLLIQNFNIYNFFIKKNLSLPIKNNPELLINIGLLWNMFT